MKTSFDILKATRHLTLKTISSLDVNVINEIPNNFNNNIAWNVGHIITTQQLLTYGLSDIKMTLEDNFIDQYRKGSSPNGHVSQEEWDTILDLLLDLPNQLENDYSNKLFQTFKTYPTSYGYKLTSIEEAIQFNNAHEALHLGYIMALKKAL